MFTVCTCIHDTCVYMCASLCMHECTCVCMQYYTYQYMCLCMYVCECSIFLDYSFQKLVHFIKISRIQLSIISVIYFNHVYSDLYYFHFSTLSKYTPAVLSKNS